MSKRELASLPVNTMVCAVCLSLLLCLSLISPQVQATAALLSQGRQEKVARSQVSIVGLLDEALQVAEQITDRYSKSIALSQIAEALTNVDAKRAKKIFEQAAELAAQINDPFLKHDALYRVVWGLSKIDVNRALRVVGQIEEPEDKAKAFSIIAATLRKTDAKRADKLWEQALQITEQIRFAHDKASALLTIANTLAEVDANRALQVAERMDDDSVYRATILNDWC